MNEFSKRTIFLRAAEGLLKEPEDILGYQDDFVKKITSYFKSISDFHLFLEGKIGGDDVSGGLASALENSEEFNSFIETKVSEHELKYPSVLNHYLNLLNNLERTAGKERKELVNFFERYHNSLPNPDVNDSGIAA